MGKKNNQQKGVKAASPKKPQADSAIQKKKNIIINKNAGNGTAPKVAQNPSSPPKGNQNKKNKKANKKQNGTENKEAEIKIPEPTVSESGSEDDESEAETEGNGDVVLTKKIKKRLKSEMKKEIILNPKSNNKSLTDIKTVAKKIEKLKSKPEAERSLKVKRKLALLEQLHDKLAKGEIVEKSESQEKKSVVTDDTISVYVGNLKLTITEEVLANHFSSIDGYLNVFLPRTVKKKKKRFAFVNFSTTEAQAEALKLNGTILEDRKLMVKPSMRKEKQNRAMNNRAKKLAKKLEKKTANAEKKPADAEKKPVDPEKKAKDLKAKKKKAMIVKNEGGDIPKNNKVDKKKKIK